MSIQYIEIYETHYYLRYMRYIETYDILCGETDRVSTVQLTSNIVPDEKAFAISEVHKNEF